MLGLKLNHVSKGPPVIRGSDMLGSTVDRFVVYIYIYIYIYTGVSVAKVRPP